MDGITLKYTFIITVNLRTLTTMKSKARSVLSDSLPSIHFVLADYSVREILSTITSGGSRIFQMGGRCFVTNGGAHILFSGKKCMKLKEIGLKWGGARLLAPCYSKITIFL